MAPFRGASQTERGDLRVLSRALSRHHVHDQDEVIPQKYPKNTQKYPKKSKHAQEADVVLLLQPHHPLHPHRIHGCAWLHFAPGFGREALSR